MPLDYTDIVTLHDSAGNPQNEGTFTHLTRAVFLELRADIDYLGGVIGMTSSDGSWNSNGTRIWTKGSTSDLSAYSNHYKSFFTDLRTACEEMAVKQSLTAPTWTILTANLTSLYSNTGAIQNEATFTDARFKSLYHDVRTALINIGISTMVFVDAVDGLDTNTGAADSHPNAILMNKRISTFLLEGVKT